MEKEEIEEKLNAIKDVPMQYGKKIWTLKSYTIDDGKVTLAPASGKMIERTLESVEFFLKELKPIESTALDTIKKDAGIPELIMTLRDILLDDIEKIRSDRGYINQAKATNNNINTLINLARLQLQMK